MPLDVAIKWLAFLLHAQEATVLILGPKAVNTKCLGFHQLLPAAAGIIH
jgi:hypothetical protein